MAIDLRLVAKGKNEVHQGLLEQARYHLKLAEEHAAELAEHNWTAEHTAGMAAEVAALDSVKFQQLDERSRAKGATRDEGAAITEAKTLINKMRNIARIVVRKSPDAGVILDEFHSGGPLGRVAGRISAYLGRVRVSAAKLDAAFAPYFKGQVLSKLIDDVRARLDEASAAQEVDMSALPEDTAAVYERMGQLLEHIEDMNAIARNAFHDEPITRAKFNKDILNRTRRRGRKAAEPVPEPTPEPTPPSA